MRMSFTLIDAATILPAFVYTLTQSKILVGLTGSLQPAGWMWPQLLMSNLLEHRPRKMKFYAFGMAVRITMWVAICLAVIFIGAQRPVTLAICFLMFYFIAASAMGVSTIPYMDIISKAFGPRLRTQYFSLRQFYGGLCSVLLGFFIRAVLGKESEFIGPFGGVTRFFKSLVNFFVFSVFGLSSELSFPYTYCTLFVCAIVTFSLSVAFFLRIREPVGPVNASRQPIRQHLKRGPYFLRIDANYRRLLLLRILPPLRRNVSSVLCPVRHAEPWHFRGNSRLFPHHYGAHRRGLKHLVGSCRETLRRQMGLDNDRGNHGAATSVRASGAILAARLADAMLLSGVLGRGSLRRRHVGWFHGISAQYRSAIESPNLSRVHEYPSVSDEFRSSSWRCIGKHCGLRRVVPHVGRLRRPCPFGHKTTG